MERGRILIGVQFPQMSLTVLTVQGPKVNSRILMHQEVDVSSVFLTVLTVNDQINDRLLIRRLVPFV